jgi:peptidyl-tRNA hydrolase
MSKEVKQVIVTITSLGMRRGKEAMQNSHAAMEFLRKKIMSTATTD